jgi:hypothetical protein
LERFEEERRDDDDDYEKKIQRRKLSIVVGKSLEKSRGERGKSRPAFKSVEEW